MRGPDNGRPEPGRCPKNNNNRHMWKINRKFYKAGQEPKQSFSNIEYICRHCGVRRVTGATSSRPEPGRCPKRTGTLPHSWVINKKW